MRGVEARLGDAECDCDTGEQQHGKTTMRHVITGSSNGVSQVQGELSTLGRKVKRRVTAVRAFFGRPGTSNRPTEAINVRLEHLRGSALGFQNLANYITRSLLETGGFRPPTPSAAMSLLKRLSNR